MGFGERSQSVESRHKSINLPSAGAGEEDRHFLLIRQLIAEEYPYPPPFLSEWVQRTRSPTFKPSCGCRRLSPATKLVCIRRRHRPRSSLENGNFATNKPSKSPATCHRHRPNSSLVANRNLLSLQLNGTCLVMFYNSLPLEKFSRNGKTWT